MPITVTPIRVKIGLRPNGHADHPDWGLLPLAVTDRVEDHQIVKWVYDKQSGHEDNDPPNSPIGVQLGLMLVTPQFATEAVATFPALVTIVTEAQLQNFWDTRAFAHTPDLFVQSDLLLALKTEYDIRKIFVAEGVGTPSDQNVTVVLQQMRRALDKDDPEPGLRPNKRRRWAAFKAKMDLIIT